MLKIAKKRIQNYRNKRWNRKYDGPKYNRSRYNNNYQKYKKQSYHPVKPKVSLGAGKWTKQGIKYNVKVNGQTIGNLNERKNTVRWIPYKKTKLRSLARYYK